MTLFFLFICSVSACTFGHKKEFKSKDTAHSSETKDIHDSSIPESNKKDDVISQPSDQTEEPKSDDVNPEYLALPLIQKDITDHDVLHFLKDGEEQINLVCERNKGNTNQVIQAFCVQNVRPKSLIELQTALNLSVGSPGVSFALTGHSSSLVGKFTSSINPRAIFFSSAAQAPNYITMGFVRGEQFAEVIVSNGQANSGDYFLVAFKQACNDQPGGCSPGELLTPGVEQNWTSFTLYQDEDIKNTIVDCMHCHQPEGPGTAKILRMQEMQNPWTHFFSVFSVTASGGTLSNDYYAAHGQTETYAGIPGPAIRFSNPAGLENFIRANGFANQPGEFLSLTIENEIATSSTSVQPLDNTDPGQSATWEQLYAAHERGEIIAPPYSNVKVTEPRLLTKFTQQYQSFLSGILSAKEMEDHRDILKTDPKERADMGFAVRPGADGPTIITQACSQCHNSKLDQSLSRAGFNANIEAMGTTMLTGIEKAIQRLKLGYSIERRKQEGIRFYDRTLKEVDLEKGEHLLTMPPRRFKDLTDEQIDAAIQYLESLK